MSANPEGITLAAILDALTLVQSQLEEIDGRGRRIEAVQCEIMARLDTIDAAQAGVTDLQPTLEHILAELRSGHRATTGGLARVAQVAGWAHAAARGNPAPLPADLLDDPLLELFVISQPADRVSTKRALADWRHAASELDTIALLEFLRRQYQPSPTDSPADRALRYQLAAISREELEGRGAALPAAPTSTIAADRSTTARHARSAELTSLWREGDEAARYAEPEIAGAMDIVAAARREGAGMPEAELSAGLANLDRTIAARLEAGDRPELAADTQAPDVQPLVDRDR